MRAILKQMITFLLLGGIAQMQKKLTLACTSCQSRNYQSNKNVKNPERLEVKKFCKRCNAHTVHRETK